jgi:hypothetical protein
MSLTSSFSDRIPQASCIDFGSSISNRRMSHLAQ